MDENFHLPRVFIELMEKIFILHADCDQGPSTTAVRIAGSSLANPFATISAGIASLWGTQHGGADEECLEMFRKIGSKDKVAPYLDSCKSKQGRLWGFGHRIFKAYDPRAAIIKKMIFNFDKQMGLDEQSKNLFEIALEIEK